MLARIALALPLVALTAVACAAPTSEDFNARSTNSSLTTAKPILRVMASKAATSSLGVTEWRIYKSKKEFVVNGYNAKGYAVKGASFGFVGSSQSSSSKVRVRLFDGSKASGTYDFRNAPNASGKSTSATAKFLKYAVADLRSVATAASNGTLKTQGHFLPAGSTPTTPANPTIPTGSAIPQSGCALSLGSLGASGTQCIQSVLGAIFGGSGGTPDLQACMAAASSVVSNVGQCMGGTGVLTNADPNVDPNAAPNAAPNAPQLPGLDPNAPDPTEGQGAPDGFDPQQAGQFADQASQDNTCASCPPGANDLAIDDETGGVMPDGEGG